MIKNNFFLQNQHLTANVAMVVEHSSPPVAGCTDMRLDGTDVAGAHADQSTTVKSNLYIFLNVFPNF